MQSQKEHGDAEVLNALDAQARFAIISADTRVQIEVQQLRDLAASENLARRQFEAFYKEARAFGARTRRQVVLFDVQRNTQIFIIAYEMNARLREGARFMDKAELDRLRPDQPYISNLFYAPLAQKNLIAVAVPVSKDGRVLYLLGVAVSPAEIFAAVKDVNFMADTITAIVDRKGVILARTAENDKFAGRKAPRNIAEREEKSGRLRGATFDGTPIRLSYLQSELSGWAAVSFVRDQQDSKWPLVAALIAALAVVVLGSIGVIVSNADQRRTTDSGPTDKE